MIIGIGLDIVEIASLQRLLKTQGEAFEQRVFTAAEREACRGRADRDQALAARFAAKEACLKALGTGLGVGTSFQQVEVVEGPNGAPGLELSGAAASRARELAIQRMHVTLTHQPGIAAAAVILER